ncbi:MAG: hypothetical protein WBL25_18655 [Anaerolineales bacterium]
MFDDPIRTIEQAKEFFKTMGCSHFHMDREFPERSQEYKLLNISKRTEEEWREEQFDDYHLNSMENQDKGSLWNLHSRMYDLFESLKTNTALMKMLDTTKPIRDKVPLKDRVIVAETINGRKMRQFRSGLIYSAYDLNNIAAAKEFAELSLHFATYHESANRGLERCQRAIELCNEIKLELGL